MDNQNQTIEPEVMPATPPRQFIVQFGPPRWLPVLRLLLSWIYRTAVAGGGIALVWNGLSPWVFVFITILLAIGPRSR